MINVDGNVNNYLKASTFDCKYEKTCEIGEHLDIKNCSSKKCVFDKLVFACADEILNTTDATVNETTYDT